MGRIHRARWGPAIEQWLDSELDPARAEEVLVHLAECPDCLREIEALARMKQSVSRIGNR